MQVESGLTYVQISFNESDPNRTTNVKSKNICSFTFISVATCTVTFGLGTKIGVCQLVTSILEISPVWVLGFGHLLKAGLQNAHKFSEAMKVCPAVIYFR
jgi:hypothetical protein